MKDKNKDKKIKKTVKIKYTGKEERIVYLKNRSFKIQPGQELVLSKVEAESLLVKDYFEQ